MELLAAAPIIFLVTFSAKGPGFQEMEACSLLINLRKGKQTSSEQPLVGEEHCVTTLITAAKETKGDPQEFQHQISSHSETEPIRRVSSSTTNNNGKKNA